MDFVRIYPPPGAPLLESKYRKMLDASQSHMSELQMRFSAPLQHRRQQEDDGNSSSLPPITGTIRRDQQVGRDCFGFTGTDKARWLLGDHGEKKAAVVPGPQQIAAAHRLMMGHSSQKTSIKPPTPPEKAPRAPGERQLRTAVPRPARDAQAEAHDSHGPDLLRLLRLMEKRGTRAREH